MGSTRTSALVFGLAGLILGGTLSWGLASSTSELPDSLAPAGDLQEIRGAIRALSAQIEGMEAAKSARGVVPTRRSRRELASDSVAPELLDRLDKSDKAMKDLQGRLDKLDTTMENLAEALVQMVKSQKTPRKAIPPLVMPQHAIDPAPLLNLTRKPEIDNDLDHFMWTYQKVLDVYGKPDRSNPSPGGKGHKWYFEIPGGGEIIFWFMDDQVVRTMFID